MIPSYLNGITKQINNNDNCIRLKVECPCGCEDFYLFVKKKTNGEIQADMDLEQQLVKQFGKKFEFQSDIDGKVFVIKRNLFGNIVKKEEIDINNRDTFKKYVSAKCSYCEKEYILFDERIHGYDACVSNSIIDSSKDVKKYSDETQKIEIFLSYNDVEEGCFDDYTIAFGRIKIFKIIGKRRLTVIDCECE